MNTAGGFSPLRNLRDIEELDVRETAELLNISANVVKVRLHRARMLLQKRLAPLLKAALPVRKRFFWSPR